MADALKKLVPLDGPIRVLDVGASPIDGAPPYQALVDHGSAEVIGFEPNPEALAELQRNAKEHEKYFGYALGDGERHELHFCRAPGMNSLYEPDPVVHSEVAFVPLYKKQPCLGEVDTLLRDLGYVLHSFFSLKKWGVAPLVVRNDPRWGHNQVIDDDAVYVSQLFRPNGLVRRGDRQAHPHHARLLPLRRRGLLSHPRAHFSPDVATRGGRRVSRSRGHRRRLMGRFGR